MLCSIRFEVLIICVFILFFVGGVDNVENYLSADEISERRKLAAEKSSEKCVKWGNTFDVSLTSKTIERPCKLPDGRPICCSAVQSPASPSSVFSKGVGLNYAPSSPNNSRVAVHSRRSFMDEICYLSKVYVSSPQELRDLAQAKEISLLSTDHTDPKRMKKLIDYVYSPEVLRNSSLWLERVKYHMRKVQDSGRAAHPHDAEYLSRFEFTRTCGSVVEKWTEWIEPITITARHPYAFSTCRPVRPMLSPQHPSTGRSDVDYVLLQSGKDLYKQQYHDTGKRVQYAGTRKGRQSVPKHFMLDSGTSTFDSSLFWFTCGYAQRMVGFDQVYAWEMTLLEPNDYWRRVPLRWKPHWHFYNVPIQADLHHADSPLRLIQEIAKPSDFVAFKLDIDHPEMEMPIALKLLSDPSVALLVDEFFFELHFRCEVYTSCGWGKRVPAESHGLVLDRPQVLQFFIDLRKNGIRAHIWP